MKMSRILTCAAVVLALAACHARMTVSPPPADFPEPMREFRAAWVATVANIDWPSKPGLPVEEQKREALQILDTLKDTNMNAAVWQIRCMCDAMYESPYEPWSEYLTGALGKPPEPYYDPLEFIIEEAHKRGIELHAWFNPYRALHPSVKSEVPEKHVIKAHPGYAVKYGNYYWLDAGNEDAARYSLDVMLDVVRRYNVDGIHMDDYFYPYPSYADNAPFPDDESYAKYQAAGGKLERDDWRRDCVNRFVQRLYTETKAIKPWVQVGISPFGIFRPGYPETVKSGFDQYAQLYADTRLWLHEGWVDYWTPQCYWKIDSDQPYKDLIAWWAAENKHNRNFWPGNGTYRIGGDSGWPVEEVPNQIEATRAQPGATGNVHFSMKLFTNNTKGLTTLLKQGVYAKPALIPPSPWLDSVPPGAVTPVLNLGSATLTWEAPADEDVKFFALYRQYGADWKLDLLPATLTSAPLAAAVADGIPDAIVVSAIDRVNNEGPRSYLKIK